MKYELKYLILGFVSWVQWLTYHKWVWEAEEKRRAMKDPYWEQRKQFDAMHRPDYIEELTFEEQERMKSGEGA